MARNSGNVTRRQEAAIAALLSTPSIPEAARLAGIPERTLYRWISVDTFKSAYKRARREIVQQAIGTIQTAMTEAVATLRQVMGDDQAPASARVSAARTLIDSGLKVLEIEDIEERVAALEMVLKGKEG